MIDSAPPPRELATLVDGIWRSYGRGLAHRVLPDGCMDFLFDLDRGTGVVIGAMDRAEVFSEPIGQRFYGVRFRPSKAALFVDAHALEIAGCAVPLADVVKSSVAALAPRLAEAESDAARALILLATLGDGRARVRAGDARVTHATELLCDPSRRIRDVALDAGLGERHLERLFLERVGVSPKRYARIARLERALGRLEADRFHHAELAESAGYSDEPHMIREFRALAGLTPRELAHERRVGFVQAPESMPR